MRLRAWKRLQKGTFRILTMSFAIGLLLHPMLVAMRAVAITSNIENKVEKPAQTSPQPAEAEKKPSEPIVSVKYAYEGVERHAILQSKVETLFKEYKAQQ